MAGKIVSCFLVILGGFIASLSYSLFILPASIAPGGVSGIAALLNFSLGLPVGITILIINIPLFLISYRHLGKEFGVRSLLGTLSISVFTDILPKFKFASQEPVMCACFGGVLLGIGLAICFTFGGSTGGIDILGKMLHEKKRDISLGNIMLAFDGVIIMLSMLISGPMNGLYSLLTVFISTKTVDFVLNGYTSTKAYCIISRKNSTILKRILSEVQRGVTVIESHGGYDKKRNNMLLCVVQRQDIAHLRRIVRQEDPSAFILVLPASEVVGNGFEESKQ